MLFGEKHEHVKVLQVDYSRNCKPCTYTRDSKPAKDPFAEKSLKGNHFKKSVKEARKLCELSGSAWDVIQEEIVEIFEDIESNKFDDAREEIYDSVATLLRLDKVLENIATSECPVREL